MTFYSNSDIGLVDDLSRMCHTHTHTYTHTSIYTCSYIIVIVVIRCFVLSYVVITFGGWLTYLMEDDVWSSELGLCDFEFCLS